MYAPALTYSDRLRHTAARTRLRIHLSQIRRQFTAALSILVRAVTRSSLYGSNQKFRSASTSAVSITAIGCATVPPAPTANLQAAQQAIANAERVEAGRYAAGELGEARTRLASADAAVIRKENGSRRTVCR